MEPVAEIRSKEDILADIETAKGMVKKFEESILSPFQKELFDLEKRTHNNLYFQLAKDEKENVELALQRLDQFYELKTQHLEHNNFIHRTGPIAIDSIYSGRFDRGREIDIYRYLHELIDEDMFGYIEEYLDRDMSDSEIKLLIVETIYNTIKDRIMLIVYDW
jgi:hypothetical protein